MEPLVVLVIGVLIAIIVLPIVAFFKASGAKRLADELTARVSSLENELRILRRTGGAAPKPEPQQAAEPVVERPRAAITPPSIATKVETIPPPLVVPPLPIQQPAAPPRIPTPPKPPINWEQFMGAKLFAWIGGLALFLGIAFFVKYSFEHNLIPPEVRVAIGFLAGIGLLFGGVLLKRKENAVTSQTLCATGVLVLYTVTFACRSFYHFAFFGQIPTFLLMALITAVALLLAIRLNAIVVAILGIAGGFLTPVLLSTGQDNPPGLFIYIALLDIGLLIVAQRQRWNVLPILGAAGTMLLQAGWIEKFFVTEKYFAENKVLVAMIVFAGFEMLFLAAVAFAKRAGKMSRALSASALGVSAIAMISAFYFLSFHSLGQRPALLFSYVFLIDLGLLALAWLNPKLAPFQAMAGFAAFVFLGAWTGAYLTNGFLQTALAFYFVFALLHSAWPLVLQRLRKITLPWWSHAFPALALVLVLMPIFKLTELSILVWPFVLFVDVLALVLAAMTTTLLPILVVLVLTLVAMGAWLFRIPGELTGLPTALFLLGGFAVFFLVAATWACRKLMAAPGTPTTRTPSLFGNLTDSANLSVQLPALSATLPFLLLIMVTLRLPLANPSPVFGLALLLIVLLLGMTKILSLDVLPAVGLASTLALEHAWHFHRFDPEHATLPLIWYLVFYAVFSIFPFVFHRSFEKKTVPWATAALSGPLHFYLVFQVIRSAYPNGVPGLLPAAFAVPSLLGLVVLLKRTPIASPARNAQLALFGGVMLFFITLIFPIQFDRQWITVGWALEGAALCWLFHRVPHPGLRIAGIGLLVIAFARLALNPAVLDYHPRASMPIWNWYLYAYGLAAACLFAAARLLAPPRNLVLRRNALPLLYSLGTILSFLLVNIEIADYFSTPGASALTFQFSGNFARDMSYSIAWALFALLLLVVGIRQKVAPVRFASLALLGVAVIKLFLHDLSQLDQLYRIGAFIAVAVIAMFASFLYQRFLSVSEKNHETESTPPSPNKLPSAFAVIALLTATSLALVPNEWRASQALDIPAPGLVRVNLLAATLDGTRSNLEDLRVIDATGNEVPYLIERPSPRPESILRPKGFRSAIEAEGTKLFLQTGTTMPLAAVSLETPAAEFIKAVRVEASHDGENWQEIAWGQPIFRLTGGATKLRVEFPEGAWEFLRLTIDDRRAQPVPFTGAQLHTPRSPAPVDAIPVTIKSRDESPGVTRLALDLGAANLPLASLRIETSEPLFTRSVTLAVPEVTDEGIREQPIGEAVIYRVDVDGKSEARLDIPVEKQIHTRELLVFIHNEDSPPLVVGSMKGDRRLVRLIFFARESGCYTLLLGNSQCAAPRYDLSGLGEQLKNAAAIELQPSPISGNPDYKAPEALAALTLSGASIDVAAWKFRKPVTFGQGGAQQLELDLDVLAHAQQDKRDVRLVRDGRQIPFLLERTSISRPIPLNAAANNDPKKIALSRWSLKLPQAAMPITRLVCTSDAPLFQRNIRLWEEVTDERGDKYPRELGRATWSRVPNHAVHEFVISVDTPPQSDTLFLETDNGDNPAIELRDFRAYHPVTRLIFKATPDPAQAVWIYYGNRNADAPRYDLSLVASQLLGAERFTAIAGTEESFSSKIGRAGETLGGSGRYLFWGALAVVVTVLLVLMSRLLPKAE